MSDDEKVSWCFYCGWIAPKDSLAEDKKFCVKCSSRSLTRVSKDSIQGVQNN